MGVKGALLVSSSFLALAAASSRQSVPRAGRCFRRSKPSHSTYARGRVFSGARSHFFGEVAQVENNILGGIFPASSVGSRGKLVNLAFFQSYIWQFRKTKRSQKLGTCVKTYILPSAAFAGGKVETSPAPLDWVWWFQCPASALCCLLGHVP